MDDKFARYDEGVSKISEMGIEKERGCHRDQELAVARKAAGVVRKWPLRLEGIRMLRKAD